jgi:hypothetical protein
MGEVVLGRFKEIKAMIRGGRERERERPFPYGRKQR